MEINTENNNLEEVDINKTKEFNPCVDYVQMTFDDLFSQNNT